MKEKIILSLPHLKHGGSERATSELANYFARQGIETIVLLMYNKPKSYQLDEKVKLIEPSKKWSIIPKFLYPFFLILFLRYHFKKEKPFSVLALGYKTYIFISCWKLNVRLIDSLRTSPNRVRFPNNKILNFIYNHVRSFVNKRIDGIISQTERAKNELKKDHNCEIVVIPNSVREIKIYDVEKENIILSVGRLSKEKGHEYLIEAFAKSNLNGWTLQFLGDGPQRSNLENQALNLGLTDSVVFEGFNSNVDFYMQKAKIFVLPSLIEGFPNALVEAMANGLACISFDCEAGPSEIIRHNKNGFLVEMKNTSMLSNYITVLAKDEKMRNQLGDNALKVRERYDKLIIGQKYIDFLLKK